MSTKKTKQTARFGARYGVGIRKRLLKIEPLQRQKHECPLCGFKKVKRVSTGIFYCGKCNTTFAGGAYLPKTTSGDIIKKMVEQKSFMANLAQLISVKEGSVEGSILNLEESRKEKTDKKEKKEAKKNKS